MRISFHTLAKYFGAALLLIASPLQAQTRKKLIYTGWDNPTTAQVARDWKVMEATPFDGFVVMPVARDEKGQQVSGGLKVSSSFSKRKVAAAVVRSIHPRSSASSFGQNHRYLCRAVGQSWRRRFLR
jgi:hypothetical protein